MTLPVLISGAGPSGLLLALWLTHLGIHYRVVDPNLTTGTTSRAIVVHARILEFYDQLGLADKAVAKGEILKSTIIVASGHERARIRLGNAGLDHSRFPFILSLAQDVHEALLQSELDARGGKVERGKSVVGVEQHGDHVEVTVRDDASGSQEVITAAYVVGCDGAHSAVRKLSGIKMEGGTYSSRFFVADVSITAPLIQPEAMTMCISPEDFVMAIQLKGDRRARLIGFTPKHLADSENVTFHDCLPSVRRNVGSDIEIHKVNWFSHYRVHHRRAAHFRQGRVLLCGDAAHLHSPVGGQGMNTGLGDVTNLAWKLAAAWDRPELDALFDTYDEERSSFAKTLIATTDGVFTRIAGSSWVSWAVRSYLIPYLAPIVAWFSIGPAVYGRVSQLGIAYPQSALSKEYGTSRGTITAGMRFPWIPNTATDSSGDFTAPSMESTLTPLRDARWHAYIFGVAEWARAALGERGVHLETFEHSSEAEKKGLAADELYLVRPDGHVGARFAAGHDKEMDARLRGYMQEWGLGMTPRI